MLTRIISFLFLAFVTLDIFAQAIVQSGVKHAVVVPVATRTTAVTTPPINNITAPKVINKKKRKPVQVTVAEKHKPATKPAAK